MTMRILLDVDGVLADFVGGYLDFLARATGEQYTAEHITQWDMDKALGLNDKVKSMCNNHLGKGGFAASLKPYPGAIEGVKKLQELGDVYIVTSPWASCPTWTSEREAWLKEHFGIPHKRVVHTAAKYLVRGSVLVDDKTSTIVKWQEEHPGSAAVLWEQPWNRNDAWAGVLTNDWDRLYRLVQALK